MTAKDIKDNVVARLEGKEYVYNVWICVEKIDEAQDDNGKDIVAEKVAKFKIEDDAIEFAQSLAKREDTIRDREGFTG